MVERLTTGRGFWSSKFDGSFGWSGSILEHVVYLPTLIPISYRVYDIGYMWDSKMKSEIIN